MTAPTRRLPTLSFGCYGTLIDWESGILVALLPVLARHELSARPDEISAAFARAESAVLAGAYLPYAEVLRRSFAGLAKDLGFAPQADELETLVEALPTWEPFHDTVAGLAQLRAAGYPLALLANVDDDLFSAGSPALLSLEFDAVVTSEQARCYKPDPAFFIHALAQLGPLAQPADQLIHISASTYRDLAPCRALGLRTIHLCRDSGRSHGAAPQVEHPIEPGPRHTRVDGFGALVASLATAATTAVG